MGRFYLDYVGFSGPDLETSSSSRSNRSQSPTEVKLYGCKKCHIDLVLASDLISDEFRSGPHKAYLFSNAINLEEGEAHPRNMTTGNHVIKNVYCVQCKTELGWKYVKAEDAVNKYKENKFILIDPFISKRERSGWSRGHSIHPFDSRRSSISHSLDADDLHHSFSQSSSLSDVSHDGELGESAVTTNPLSSSSSPSNSSRSQRPNIHLDLHMRLGSNGVELPIVLPDIPYSSSFLFQIRHFRRMMAESNAIRNRRVNRSQQQQKRTESPARHETHQAADETMEEEEGKEQSITR